MKISKWKCWLGYICLLQERGQNPPNVRLKFVWSGQNFPILAFWLPVLHTRGQIKDISLSKYRCTFLSLFLTSAIMILRRCMELYIFVQDLKMKDDKRVKLQQDKDRTHQMFQHWNELSVLALRTSSLWSVNTTSQQNLLQRIPVTPVFQMETITLWHQELKLYTKEIYWITKCL